MTALQIGERITIAKLIEKLQTVQFDELTYEKYQELFNGYNLQGLQDAKFGLKDLFIDDYIFTVYQLSDKESTGVHGFKLNNTLGLSKDVEVWLPSDNNGSNDIQADGTIKQVDNLFYLKVSYTVD